MAEWCQFHSLTLLIHQEQDRRGGGNMSHACKKSIILPVQVLISVWDKKKETGKGDHLTLLRCTIGLSPSPTSPLQSGTGVVLVNWHGGRATLFPLTALWPFMCPSCLVYGRLTVRSCSTTLNMHKLGSVAHHTARYTHPPSPALLMLDANTSTGGNMEAMKAIETKRKLKCWSCCKYEDGHMVPYDIEQNRTLNYEFGGNPKILYN